MDNLARDEETGDGDFHFNTDRSRNTCMCDGAHTKNPVAAVGVCRCPGLIGRAGQEPAREKSPRWRWRPFAAAAAPIARQFQFHPSQEIEHLADGSMLVRFKASGHLEMSWHLYAWGDSVEVIQPAGLAAMVHPYRRNDFAALP